MPLSMTAIPIPDPSNPAFQAAGLAYPKTWEEFVEAGDLCQLLIEAVIVLNHVLATLNDGLGSFSTFWTHPGLFWSTLDKRTSTSISGTSESCHYEISGGRSRRGFSCYRPMIV